MHTELVLFNDLKNASILKEMYEIADYFDQKGSETKSLYIQKDMLAEVINHLTDFAVRYGFHGNIWQHYITNLLVSEENSISLSAEHSEVSGTLYRLLLHDCNILRNMFQERFEAIGDLLGYSILQLMFEFDGGNTVSEVYNSNISEAVNTLSLSLAEADTNQEFANLLLEFYRKYGTGVVGLHRAFRVRDKSLRDKENLTLRDIIEPIHNMTTVYFDDLIGLNRAKERLRANTEAFIEGKRADNCLLYGDAGTGKSTSIKALANEYYSKGLRVIEIYKHQFDILAGLIGSLKNRNYKFIIFMDDLSFEDYEIEYKYLKAVIEGGLEKRPDNVLIYATSNRRHLVDEKFSEREDSVHSNDNIQEKLSLASRFGCSIYFGAPDRKEFMEIVTALADREGLTVPREELMEGASAWELRSGGRTGRCARQYIDHLSCQKAGGFAIQK